MGGDRQPVLARGGDERIEDLGRDELVDLDEIRARGELATCCAAVAASD